MTRTTWVAAALAVAALGTILLGMDPADEISRGVGSIPNGLALIAYGVVATGFLCTAAVLWVRSEQRPQPASRDR